MCCWARPRWSRCGSSAAAQAAESRGGTPLSRDLKFDVAALGDLGLPTGPPVLEFYNLPVRLAAVVLAPVGPGRRIAAGQINSRRCSMRLVPGLDKVVALHRPLLAPLAQPSQFAGFRPRLLQQRSAARRGGKGTPWSSVAGVFKLAGQPVMAGLVVRAPAAQQLRANDLSTPRTSG